MGTTKRTAEEKNSLVRAWLEVRARRAMTQEEFARHHGIGVRTLRAYLAEYTPVTAPVQQLREILKDTLAMFQRLADRLDALDAEPAAASAPPIMPNITPTAAMLPTGKEDRPTPRGAKAESFWG